MNTRVCDHILYRLQNEEVTLKELELIIGCVIPSNYVDKFGNNALHCYVSNKCDTDINVIKLLLSCGVDRLYRNKNGLTPLGVYSKHRYVKTQIVNLLISSYSDRNRLESNINDFDLYSYISSDSIDVRLLKYLIIDKRIRPLTRIINIGLIDAYVMIPNPRLDVLKVLLSAISYNTNYLFCRCTNENYGCRNALHYYILSHTKSLSKDIIKCLIDNGISTNVEDDNKCLPIQYYWSYSVIDIEIVKLLIKDIKTCRVVNDDSRPYIRGVLADYLNTRFRGPTYNVDMNIVRLLIESTYDLVDVVQSITSYDSREYNYDVLDNVLKGFSYDNKIIQTIMMHYLHYNDNVCIQIIQHMLDNGAKMDVMINGNYPLHEYFMNDRYLIDANIVRFIIENNGHVAINKLSNNGRLCIHTMATSRFNNSGYIKYENIMIDIMRVLIKYIDDIDMVNTDKKNMLYYAVEYRNIKLVKWLLENGANINTPTHRSVINKAIKNSSFEKVNILGMINLLLSYHPSIESMIYAFNKDVYYIRSSPSLACIRYALILDIDFPTKIKFDISHLKELKRYKIDINRMKNESISGISMFDIFFKRSGHYRLRYAKNLTFLNFASKVKWYKEELTSIITDTVKNSEWIDDLVAYLNEDVNEFSRLPIEIQYKILYHSLK
ncbi:ankyrin [Skunkpox virus]|uniref:Ankyrin n=1 Tax=Skunkpox virus TaxID=160796 RepID=A0A1C9KC02_9POXV|nr:ankyrin [Skunkpox virus]AOP31687.1 ankyrin [Skunkpox virus]